VTYLTAIVGLCHVGPKLPVGRQALLTKDMATVL